MGAKRLVLDSLTVLTGQYENQAYVRQGVLGLIQSLSSLECTSILISEGSEVSPDRQHLESRDKIVEEGLSFLRAVLEDKRVVLVDDSIVRGTNIRKIVRGLKNAGAKEVHVRIGCPPLIAPCYLGIDMRNKKEFIARDTEGNIKSWDQIAMEIEADSLGYISIDGLKEAIGFEICKGCIEFPNGYPPEMQQDFKKLFKHHKGGMRAYECI